MLWLLLCTAGCYLPGCTAHLQPRQEVQVSRRHAVQPTGQRKDGTNHKRLLRGTCSLTSSSVPAAASAAAEDALPKKVACHCHPCLHLHPVTRPQTILSVRRCDLYLPCCSPPPATTCCPSPSRASSLLAPTTGSLTQKNWRMSCQVTTTAAPRCAAAAAAGVQEGCQSVRQSQLLACQSVRWSIAAGPQQAQHRSSWQALGACHADALCLVLTVVAVLPVLACAAAQLL
jgi:hypothetical protein